MDFLKFDAVKCTLCGKCIDKCPFGALRIEGKGIAATHPSSVLIGATALGRSLVPRLTALVQNRKED